jgi:fibronectin type 3 domain-containing protein
VPGFEGEQQRPLIDISWEPDVEPRVAGYRVYRRDTGDAAWQRVGPELVTGAAYRDATVAAGHRYAYRVTAVSTAGNESGPSGEAAETAPTP